MFIPALVPLGLILTGAALWPFIEQWITGDKREHHIIDRPRNAPTRTAIGMAMVAFYGVLWLEGANDLIADHFTSRSTRSPGSRRFAIFIVPVVAYIVTKRICLGLQRKDLHLLEHGVETGIIRQLPSGEFIEETRPLIERSWPCSHAGAGPGLPAGHPGRAPDVPRQGCAATSAGSSQAEQGRHREPPVDGHGYGHGTGTGTATANPGTGPSGGARAGRSRPRSGTTGRHRLTARPWMERGPPEPGPRQLIGPARADQARPGRPERPGDLQAELVSPAVAVRHLRPTGAAPPTPQRPVG